MVLTTVSERIPVTVPILLENASQFHNLLYAESLKQFMGSYGFQWHFATDIV